MQGEPLVHGVTRGMRVPQLATSSGLKVLDEARPAAAYSGAHSLLLACGKPSSKGSLVAIEHRANGSFAFRTDGGTSTVEDPASAAAVSPDGQWLAAAVGDTVSEYALPQLSFERSITSMPGIRALAFSSDGSHL